MSKSALEKWTNFLKTERGQNISVPKIPEKPEFDGEPLPPDQMPIDLAMHGGNRAALLEGLGFKGNTWGDVARVYGIHTGNAARKRWKSFLGSNRGLELKAVNSDGTIKMGRKPLTDELPPTDGLELKFITKNITTGGGYVRYEPPKKDADKLLTKEDIAQVLKDASTRPAKVKDWSRKPTTGKIQVLKVSDAHVGMAAEDNIFDLGWNTGLLFERSDVLLTKVDPDASEIVLIFGGDIADGQNGYTTRGGHKLPQNMKSREQLTWSKDWVLYLLDGITSQTSAKVRVIFVANSNHGGGVLYFATGSIVAAVAPYRYDGQVEFLIQEAFIESHEVGGFSILVTHGYDEQYMKRGWPRFLQKAQMDFIETFIRYRGVKNPVLVRGDQHQYHSIPYPNFHDLMVPAFSNPSSWVSMNFAAIYKGGFVDCEIVDGEISFKLVSFKK